MRNKFIAFLLALVICLAPCVAWAEGQQTQALIEDPAGVLAEEGSEEYQKLQQEIARLQQDTGICFAVFTAETLEGQQGEDYLTGQQACMDMVGTKAPYVIVLYDAEQVYFYSYAGNGAEVYFPEGNMNEMLQAGLQSMEQTGDLHPFLYACISYVAEKVGEQPAQEMGDPAEQARTYVIDGANLLTQEEAEQLQADAEELYDRFACDVVMVTTDSTDGKAAMDYADDYYDYNGYGADGLLLLIDMGNREWWISTSGKCIQAFTDWEIDMIGEDVAGYLSGGDYKGAFDEFLWWVDYELEDYADSDLWFEGKDPDRPAPGSATVFVVDDDQLLSEEQERELSERIQKLRIAYNSDVVILTVNDRGSQSAMRYADDYYDYNGYANDGVLLLIDMHNREWYISTAGRCIYAFSDREIQQIGRRIAKGLKKQDYMEACNAFLQEVDSELYDYHDGKKGPALHASGFGISLKHWWRNINWVAVLIAWAIALLIACLIVNGMKRRMKTARLKNQASDYIRPGSFQLTHSADIYLYSHTTSRRIEHDHSSSGGGGGGGGSSTHTSSSGSSHGGGGGRF